MANIQTLLDKQNDFAVDAAVLILEAQKMGYTVTLGHALRRSDCKQGMKDSVHKVKLAIDLNLFLNDVYLKDTKSCKTLGVFWESLGDFNCWGGRFCDGNHFSYEHNGVR